MFRSALACLVAGCAALAAPASHTFNAAPASSSTVQARERVLYVSIVDRATRQPVPGLGPDAFVVREDGARREVLRVTRATSPMPTAIVVDNSQAMAPSIADLRRGLTAFVNSLEGIGPTTIVTVADRPTIVQGYTTSKAELTAATGRLFHSPNSGATLLDAITEVASGLARRESDRAAIVAVTGEYIDFSHRNDLLVLDELRASGAQLHAVVLLGPGGPWSSDEARYRATVLDRGPRDSGGVRIDVLTSMSFEPRLAELAAMLVSQYRVVYARPESLIVPEKVEVSAARPAHEAYGSPARGQEAR
jgi:hypothetical protein